MPENNQPEVVKNTSGQKWHHKSFKELFKEFREFLDDLVDIKDGMDQKGTIINIHNNKEMKGANAWLLMCSIMVASLGLDLNSPAVIIGAMLISPLMSPILGIGLGVGINDRETLFTSLKHFGIAIIIALLTSFLYFKITPFGSITNEISARTAPNLLDGLVAIFGGLAGVISTTRLDKSNAIPGVAIATALMPPLCVAGFGLANGQWQFFLNAFYLFFLNSFFIAISTYIVIRILGFRYKVYPNEKETKRNRLVIFCFAFIILLPAILLLNDAYQKVQERTQIKEFITAHFENDSTTISDWKFIPSDTLSKLHIKLIGDPVSEATINDCDTELERILNKTIQINTYQSEEIPFADIEKIKAQLGGIRGEFAKLSAFEQKHQSRLDTIKQLNIIIDSLKSSVDLSSIYKEVKTIYPLIEEIGLNKQMQKTNFTTETNRPVLLIKWSAKKSSKQKKQDQERLKNFIEMRTKLDSVMVLTY